MKGVGLVTKVVVLIILGILVLAVFVWWVGQGKGSVDIVLAQTILRQCCSDRAIWDCGSTAGINCKVPWGTGSEPMDPDLMDRAGVTDLTDFCNC